jgi:hypothetical protein
VEIFEDARLERQEDATLGLPVWRTGEKVPGVAARARATAAASPGGQQASPGATQTSPEPAVPKPEAPAKAREPMLATPAPASASAVLPVSWAAVAAVSKAAPPVEEGEREPKRGDFVEHRQFGLCRVEGEDADGGTQVRLPSGARKVLRLDVMEVLPPRREADRTIFPVRPRSR